MIKQECAPGRIELQINSLIMTLSGCLLYFVTYILVNLPPQRVMHEIQLACFSTLKSLINVGKNFPYLKTYLTIVTNY